MLQPNGFTLFELMISIAIIAILSAIGIPAYQGYIQKAAMTDALQAVTPYRTAIELCLFEQGSNTACEQNQQGIPDTRSTRYVKSIQVKQGTITLNGKEALEGLTLTLSPSLESGSGAIQWSRQCSHSGKNQSLLDACQSVFRFDEKKS